jgi:YHS domain-containing protein
MATNNSTSSTNDIVDPVCQMTVHPGRNQITATYKDQRYYFCAQACRESFAANPEKYLSPTSPKRKGLWGRYLDRLNKVTGGKPPKCCH